MNFRIFSKAVAVLFTVIILTWHTQINAELQFFPVYGSGSVEVRMYSDYLCPPCQQLEPDLEPLFRKLEKKKIKLVFVDVPGHEGSSLYARFFLYALNFKNRPEEAFHVRGVLFRAAPHLNMTTREKFEELFNGKKIGYTIFNPNPVFEHYNALIREDRIDTTPTCVIIRNGKKDKFVGRAAITKAMESLL